MDLANTNFSSAFDENFSTNARNNHLDLWSDFLSYAENLNCNWLVSQDIFRNSIVPTAQKDPMLFARWVRTMVKSSGRKIKSRTIFAKSLKILRKFKNQNASNNSELSIVITELLEAGLKEPSYAKLAINKICP